MTTVARVMRSQVGRPDLIAKGGQGRIHRAPDLRIPGETGPFVFKEFRRKDYAIVLLDHIAGFRQRLEPAERTMLDKVCVWPLRVVETDDGRADGVVLHLIHDRYFQELELPSGKKKRVPRDAQFLSQPPERSQKVGLPLVGVRDRYRVCRDIALALGFLHRRDVCFGDVSFRNVVICLGDDPCVRLVDCDAVRLRGQAPVVEQAHTPDWVPPEGSRTQAESTDRYKLGLFILRALVPQALSAQNVDPSWADHMLDRTGRQLLRRALRRDPHDRTRAKEWYAYFRGAVESRSGRTAPLPRGAPRHNGRSGHRRARRVGG